MTSCICLGPKRAGKTHLLKALQDPDSIDETSYSMPTIGTGIYRIHFPTKSPNADKHRPPPPPIQLVRSTFRMAVRIYPSPYRSWR